MIAGVPGCADTGCQPTKAYSYRFRLRPVNVKQASWPGIVVLNEISPKGKDRICSGLSLFLNPVKVVRVCKHSIID